MAKPMNHPQLPDTDSIRELARFWDEHDLTDFEDQLQEVSEPVFERKPVVKIPLEEDEAAKVDALAKSKGVGAAELIHEWILEKTRHG